MKTDIYFVDEGGKNIGTMGESEKFSQDWRLKMFL